MAEMCHSEQTQEADCLPPNLALLPFPCGAKKYPTQHSAWLLRHLPLLAVATQLSVFCTNILQQTQ